MSEWTRELPTEPGWYFLNMTGAKSGVRRTEVVELGIKPANMHWPGECLAFKQWNRDFRDYIFCELRFHPDCEPVWWKRIEDPAEPTIERSDDE